MTKKRFFTALTVTALAGALTLTALTGCSGGGSTTSTLTPTNAAAGSLLLSVNPEIELEYDDQGNTLALAGINDDGAAVLSDYAGYEGKPADDVVEELIGRIYAAGYFQGTVDGHPKNLVLKLENGSQYPSDDFLERIAADARTVLETQQVSAQTLTIDEDDYDDQYRDQGYINAQTAESILSAQLGRSDLQFVEKDYDIDDGTYEIEFVLDGVEYEYEVNASTGKVLEVDAERHNANDDWGDDVGDDWDDRFDDDDDWDDDRDDDHDDDWDDDWDDDRDDAVQASTQATAPQAAAPQTPASQPAAPTPVYDDDWDDRNDDWDDDIGENRSDDWDDDHDDDDDWDDDDDDDDDDDWDDDWDDDGDQDDDNDDWDD